ncbi:hypothetical protein K9N68_20715 [Kovacikia minuta CCNUW1]|uniref:hypothetical protein n=1 Tax=Kovacikia minuta TaxID=2931930 RepID=UPI001CCE05EC|nr:hypothetical protein K9N68_20715 [Kovacikia minuta CCNUW1]
MRIVERLAAGYFCTPEDWKQLENWALADRRRAIAFDITAENVGEAIQAQARLLQAIYPTFTQFCQTRSNATPAGLLNTLWTLWLPLAVRLAKQCQAQQRPFVQGILGGQGTGKTTLGAVLTLILAHLGYPTLSLSLDDLYKTYSDRLLLQTKDPRLIWRGPPGTHDVDLGIQLLGSVTPSQSRTTDFYSPLR